MLLDSILIELAIKQENGWLSVGAIDEEENIETDHQNKRLINGRFMTLCNW